MVVSLQDLKAAASGLPVTDRADLADYLIQGLDEEPSTECHSEWLQLASSRLEELETGKVKGILADEIGDVILGEVVEVAGRDQKVGRVIRRVGIARQRK